MPESLRSTLFPSARTGAFGLLRDLHSLLVLHSETHVALTVVMQAAKELRDERLLDACHHLEERGLTQKAWLENQIKHRAPHTLVVPQ